MRRTVRTGSVRLVSVPLSENGRDGPSPQYHHSGRAQHSLMQPESGTRSVCGLLQCLPVLVLVCPFILVPLAQLPEPVFKFLVCLLLLGVDHAAGN
jgi:hypothetical protein